MAAPLEQQIGDHVFVIGHILARKGPKALRQFAKVAGPLMGEIVKFTKAGTAGDVEISKAVIEGKLDGLIRLLGDVDDELLMSLMMELAGACSVKGMNGTLAANFDIVFGGGELMKMGRWFLLAARVNFGDFWRLLEDSKG